MQAFGFPDRLLMAGNSVTHNDPKMTQNDAKTAVNLSRSPVKWVIQEGEPRLIDAMWGSRGQARWCQLASAPAVLAFPRLVNLAEGREVL